MLSFIQTKRKRMQKRKCSFMFAVYSFSLSFGLNMPYSQIKTNEIYLHNRAAQTTSWASSSVTLTTLTRSSQRSSCSTRIYRTPTLTLEPRPWPRWEQSGCSHQHHCLKLSIMPGKTDRHTDRQTGRECSGWFRECSASAFPSELRYF